MSGMPKRLRERITGTAAWVLPGCHDALSARLIEQAGFPAAYMSGSAVTASLLGGPDLGLISSTEMIEQARRITAAIDIPLVCDIDTGYGNALNLRRTVQLMERAGVAGIQIEDQTFPKRCGHFSGKEIIPREEMVAKIRAACDARQDPDFVIIARTDARALTGIDDAIDRAAWYAEAGADVLFIEAPQTREEIEQVAHELSHPLLINMVEGGKTPILPFADLAAMGYQIILYPTAGIRAVMKTLQTLYAELHATGGTDTSLDRLVAFEERNEITGLAHYAALEERYRIG